MDTQVPAVLEARQFQIKVLAGLVSVLPLSGWLEGGHLLDGASRGLPCIIMSSLPLLRRTPVLMDEGRPIPHFSNYLFKNALSKYSHILSS